MTIKVVIGILLVFSCGGLGLAILSFQYKFIKEARAELAENPLPGSRRRATIAFVGFFAFVLLEVAIFIVGEWIGGPYLGGGLVALDCQ